MAASVRDAFLQAAAGPDPDVARAALAFARIEYGDLDPAPYLARLDEMAAGARETIGAAERQQAGVSARIAALTHYMYAELGFEGARIRYDDPRNSLLNTVLDRRAGIPITLAVVLIEVGARAGVRLEGVSFPGHFLVRAPADRGEIAPPGLLMDPFHKGEIVTEADCARLLRTHAGDDAVLSPGMFAAAGAPQILTRMLLNLKRAYVRMRSFGHARRVTELLVALEPAALVEVRDRGLLAYHLEDYPAALRDLQRYLRYAPAPQDDDTRRERDQVREHVKALERRLASLN